MPLTPDPEVQRFVGLLIQEIDLSTPTAHVSAQNFYNAVNTALDRYNNGESP